MLAVFAVVLLTVLAVGITAVVRVELLSSRAAVRKLQALFLAEAGVNHARALLLYDDERVDTLADAWGPLHEETLELPRALGPGFYRVRVHDAAGRINVNLADLQTLARLTGSSEIAAAIAEWRGQAGSGRAYYEGLPYPYLPREGPFQTLGELLLVRGITPELFHSREGVRRGLRELLTVESSSLNTDAEGGQRLNLNSFRAWDHEAFRDSVMAKLGAFLTMYDAEQIWHGLNLLPGNRYTSLAQLTTVAGLDFDKVVAVLDQVTVADGPRVPGQINVNTAPLEVLLALPGSSPQLAAGIIERRADAPFRSLGEVAQALFEHGEGLVSFTLLIDRLTTKSSSFIIESMGYTEEGGYATVVALVRRREGGVELVAQWEVDEPLSPPEVGLEYAGLLR